MKKNLISIFLSAFMLAGLTGCFEDEGNYDYDDIFEISVSGISSSYECFSLVDTLRIKPDISPNEEMYDYFWGVYLDVAGNNKIDTVSHELELNMPIKLSPNKYKILFGAKEKKTGIQKLVKSDLRVSTALSKGWYILRSQNGTTDIDLFTPKGKIENVIAMNNDGKNLKGDAVAINHTVSYNVFDENMNRYLPTNCVFAMSENGMVAMRLHNGQIVRDFNSIFYTTPSICRPQALVFKWADCFLFNDGKAYSIYGMVPNSGRFGEPKTATSDYKLSNHIIGHAYTDPIFFDENINSFCTADSYGGNIVYFKDSDTEFPSNKMGIDLLYLGAGPKKDWAIARKKDSGVMQLLELNPNATRRPYKNLITNCSEITDDLGLGKAYKWAANSVNNIIYFAKEDGIYSSNIDAGFVENIEYKLPTSEKVSYMRYLTYSNYKEPDTNFNVLAVATTDGSNYKIYLFDIQAGSLAGEPEILQGQGKVNALIYINNTMSTKIF